LLFASIEGRVPSCIMNWLKRRPVGERRCKGREERLRRVVDKLIGGIDSESGEVFFNGDMPSARKGTGVESQQAEPLFFG